MPEPLGGEINVKVGFLEQNGFGFRIAQLRSKYDGHIGRPPEKSRPGAIYANYVS